jgi:hypothetical protein
VVYLAIGTLPAFLSHERHDGGYERATNGCPLVEKRALDALRSRMGDLSSGLSRFLGAITSLSDAAPSSELYNRILMQAQKASRLSCFQVFIDGGVSWGQFLTESE